MRTVHPVVADAVVHSEDVDSAADVVEESSVVDVAAVNSVEGVVEVHPAVADEVSMATVDVEDLAASTSNRTATAEHKRRPT